MRTISLADLIKRLQEEENPNLRFQDTNVTDIEHTSRGIKLVTVESEEVDALRMKVLELRGR